MSTISCQVHRAHTQKKKPKHTQTCTHRSRSTKVFHPGPNDRDPRCDLGGSGSWVWEGGLSPSHEKQEVWPGSMAEPSSTQVSVIPKNTYVSVRNDGDSGLIWAHNFLRRIWPTCVYRRRTTPSRTCESEHTDDVILCVTPGSDRAVPTRVFSVSWNDTEIVHLV